MLVFDFLKHFGISIWSYIKSGIMAFTWYDKAGSRFCLLLLAFIHKQINDELIVL